MGVVRVNDAVTIIDKDLNELAVLGPIVVQATEDAADGSRYRGMIVGGTSPSCPRRPAITPHEGYP